MNRKTNSQKLSKLSLWTRVSFGLCLILFMAQILIGQTTQEGSLVVKATTDTFKGKYGPRNTAAMWITNSKGEFVKTIGIWANKYKWTLGQWDATSKGDKSGISKNFDGLSAASRSSHGTITGKWDLKDKNGVLVPPGVYYYHVEMNETNDKWRAPYLRGEVTVGSSDAIITGYKVQKDTNSGKIFNLTATFTSGGADKQPPSLTNASTLSQKKVRVGFSEPVDSVSAVNLKNYSLSYKKKDSKGNLLSQVYPMTITSIAYVSASMAVDITTDNHYSNEQYILIVSDIPDKSSPANKMAKDTVSYVFQKITSTNLTENLPKAFQKSAGIKVGDSVVTSFVVYENPSQVLWSAFEVNWNDLDDTLEAAITLNGSAKKFYGDPKGVVGGQDAWGAVDFDPGLLKNGINTATIKFNSDLNGSTSGFSVLAMKFDYEVALSRDATPLVSGKNQISEKINSIRVSYTSGVYQFNIPEDLRARDISIYNSTGKLIHQLDPKNTSWNGIAQNGERIKNAVAYVKVKGEKNQMVKVFLVR